MITVHGVAKESGTTEQLDNNSNIQITGVVLISWLNLEWFSAEEVVEVLKKDSHTKCEFKQLKLVENASSE